MASRDDVRALMRARAHKRAGRITSPLAMYNNVGRLVCKLCKVQVESDVLWEPHCKSVRHLQVVRALQQRRRIITHAASEAPAGRQIASSQGATSGSRGPGARARAKPTRGLVAATSDSDDSDSDDSDDSDRAAAAGVRVASSAGLGDTVAAEKGLPAQGPGTVPTDFFDAGGPAAAQAAPQILGSTTSAGPRSAAATVSAGAATVAEGGQSVPVGFFDNPAADAAARHVDVAAERKEAMEADLQELEAMVAGGKDSAAGSRAAEEEHAEEAEAKKELEDKADRERIEQGMYESRVAVLMLKAESKKRTQSKKRKAERIAAGATMSEDVKVPELSTEASERMSSAVFDSAGIGALLASRRAAKREAKRRRKAKLRAAKVEAANSGKESDTEPRLQPALGLSSLLDWRSKGF